METSQNCVQFESSITKRISMNSFAPTSDRSALLTENHDMHQMRRDKSSNITHQVEYMSRLIMITAATAITTMTIIEVEEKRAMPILDSLSINESNYSVRPSF